MYGKELRFTDYIDKTHCKIEFFSNLSNYEFVALYHDDLKDNLKGLKDKLNKILSK